MTLASPPLWSKSSLAALTMTSQVNRVMSPKTVIIVLSPEIHCAVSIHSFELREGIFSLLSSGFSLSISVSMTTFISLSVALKEKE
jgi:hypothetical protein